MTLSGTESGVEALTENYSNMSLIRHGPGPPYHPQHGSGGRVNSNDQASPMIPHAEGAGESLV